MLLFQEEAKKTRRKRREIRKERKRGGKTEKIEIEERTVFFRRHSHDGHI